MKKLTMMMMVVLMVVMSSTVAFANVANTTAEQNMEKVESGKTYMHNGVEVLPGETFEHFGVTMMYTEDGELVAVKSEEEILAEKEFEDYFKKVANNMNSHMDNMDKIATSREIHSRTSGVNKIIMGFVVLLLFAFIGKKFAKGITKTVAKKIAVEKKETSSEKEVANS